MIFIRIVLCYCLLVSAIWAQGDAHVLGHGADLIDVYPINHDTVALQIGRSILRLKIHEGGSDVTGMLRLSPETFVFDIHEGGAVAVGSHGVKHIGFSSDSIQTSLTKSDLFRDRASTHPLQRALLADTSRFIAPTLSGFEFWGLKDQRPIRLGQLAAPPSSEQTLGWGLGYRMSSQVTLPAVSHGDLDGDGKSDLLLRSGTSMLASLSKDNAWGPPQLWGKAPRKLDTEIINFEQRVPSITADVNGDGCADHILFDPGAGCLFFYSSRDRHGAPSDRQPDQIIKVSGWILHGLLFDFDNDGSTELFLLSIPKLNLLGQLRAFKKSLLSVQLEVRKITSDGLISRSPIIRQRCELPVVISLTRNRRVCNYRALFAPIKTATSWALLMPGEDGIGTVIQPYNGKTPTGDSTPFWPALPSNAHFTRPFAPISVGEHLGIIGVVRSARTGRAIVRRVR